MKENAQSLALVDTYNDILSLSASESDMKRENANINTNSPMGMMLKIGTESMKKYIDEVVLPKELSVPEKEGYVHYHDKDFSLITFNCCQIDLKAILAKGFHTGHGFVRSPQSIRSAATLSCIIIQSNQNDMFGGQSLLGYDSALADYVKKSFYKNIISHSYNALCYTHSINSFMSLKEFSTAMKNELDKDKIFYTEKDKDKNKKLISYKEISRSISKVLENYIFSQLSVNVINIYTLACDDVEDETHQAMEAAVHNFCTLQSRAGSQTPFSSVNFGMDTSPEGRLVSKELLNAIDEGLGHGETVIFTISIFTIKSGINYNPEDPNYDLFIRACEVSAKRLYPNFTSQDASFNLPYYKEDDYRTVISVMGWRKPKPILVNHLTSGC